MADRKLKISFENCSAAEASIMAQGLEEQLRDASPTTQFNVERARQDAQDFGTTLVLVFGTPVAIVLAKAVCAFLQRNSGASISISEDGTVVAKNLESKDAATIAEAFARKPA